LAFTGGRAAASFGPSSSSISMRASMPDFSLRSRFSTSAITLQVPLTGSIRLSTKATRPGNTSRSMDRSAPTTSG
jgi:hypothetical protein